MLSQAERNNQLQIMRPNGAIFFIVGISDVPLYKTSTLKVPLFWQQKPQTGMTVMQGMWSEHRDSILYDRSKLYSDHSRVTAGSLAFAAVPLCSKLGSTSYFLTCCKYFASPRIPAVHLTNTLFVARQNYTKKKRGGGAEGK
jgi:hypothetical protein